MASRVIVLSEKPINTLEYLKVVLKPLVNEVGPDVITFSDKISSLSQHDVEIHNDSIIISSINSEIESCIKTHRRVANLTLLLKDDVCFIRNSSISILDDLIFVVGEDRHFDIEYLPRVLQFLHLETIYQNTVARAKHCKDLIQISN